MMEIVDYCILMLLKLVTSNFGCNLAHSQLELDAILPGL